MDAVLARDTSHISKLALIFAICDECFEIDTPHLNAAVAVMDYCQASARWIFGQATGNKLANNILWKLRRSQEGLTRTQISQEVCYGKTPAVQLEKALSELIRNKLAKFKLEPAPSGPPMERWFATG
jgi:hypothetical protein